MKNEKSGIRIFYLIMKFIRFQIIIGTNNHCEITEEILVIDVVNDLLNNSDLLLPII